MQGADPFHALSIEETFAYFKTSEKGLNKEEVRRRQAEFGRNVLAEKKIGMVALFLRQFNHLLIYVLMAASLMSVAIGEWTDFFVINAIILINGLIGFWQERKAEVSINALKKLTESRCKVMREGHLVKIASSELVPGDYVVLHEGEVITADLRLVGGAGLMLDESSLTGESVPVVKDPKATVHAGALPYELSTMLLAGTSVTRGSGQAVVVKTGGRTYLAQIAERSKEEPRETSLMRAIRFFSKRYVFWLAGLLLALGLFGLWQGRDFLELSYILIASLVSAVPEGLPIVITLVMVIGAISLSRRKTLIRYLPSVETLGSATVIASDKTGTITEGKLTVKEVYAKDLQMLKLVAALCNDAQEGMGDPLDVALARWVNEFDALRKRHPRKWTFSFDSRHMLMASLNEVEGKEVLFIKGAYESLKEKAVNLEDLEEMEKRLGEFLHLGLRVLAFGTGKREGEDPSQWKIKIIGLIGFLDAPKAGVKEAVHLAKTAGIRVLMITGDHPLTAHAVAKEIGIHAEGQEILIGREIEHFSDEELFEALQDTTVLARILPEHKYRVVKLLQKRGEIVAVTGDGVNDVPALNAADIGIAMGGGTEAAKSVAKMVITDNNLRVIVDAIENARVIADTIRKVIYYLTSTSLQELCLLALSLAFFLPLPLTAIQILWVNLVTDGVQDKTFAFLKSEGDVMKRPPRRPEKQFFDRVQLLRIGAFGLVLGGLTFALYLYLLDRYPMKEVSTIVFTSIVLAQWANGIQAQKEKEPFFQHFRTSFSINPTIYAGFGIGIGLQCIVLYVIPDLFHSTPLPLEAWVYPVGLFFAAFAFVEIRKWIEIIGNRCLRYGKRR